MKEGETVCSNDEEADKDIFSDCLERDCRLNQHDDVKDEEEILKKARAT